MTSVALSLAKPGRALAATLALAGLLPVSGHAAPTAGDRAVAGAERRVARAPSADSLVELAAAFMRKARETGDPSYYGRAGAAVERALAGEPDHFPALRMRASVLLGQHAFARALRVARLARRLRPHDWPTHGNLADACVELGYYRGATHATARMMTLRPGVPAYTRVAALRSLTGDRRGAIDALVLALDAADPTDPEARAWLLAYLGHEHWGLGERDRAAARYEQALAVFPDHHVALPGLARARAAQGRTGEAIALFERALALAPSPSIAGALGALYVRTGDPIRARASYEFGAYMGRVATARGQTLGRELALFLADHDRDLDEALRLARADARARDDVYTQDALAWVLFKRGDLPAAKRAIARALRLGTEDASFHRHAQRIASALGRDRSARRHATTARMLEVPPPAPEGVA